MTNHDQFYSFAEAYDVAFDFKNIKSECQFLCSLFEKHHYRQPKSFLDIAAGPALHAIEMSSLGLNAAALDAAQEMVEYGLKKARRSQASIRYYKEDMIRFVLPEKFDMAGIFMDSTSYLLSNEAVYSHLNSVANCLHENGLYILEMGHPRDVFAVGTSTINSWIAEKDGLWTSTSWGHAEDKFDPISQITETSVKLVVRKDGLENELHENAPQRCFTRNEFDALVKAEGSFEIIEFYGALDVDVPFTNEKKSWRMIPILRKRS